MVKKAAVVATLFTLAQAGTVAAQGSLQGTITAAGTGSALAGAQVSLPDLSLGAITGPNGAYEVGDIPAGTHEVVVVIIGYQTERRQVTITDGQTATLNVALAETALELEGLVAVGSRARPRTVTESPVPVDVIPTTDIVQQGDTDFANLLRNVVPSFNVNIQPISDAATFARPANLRGLAPDHTLVLINGKRRHRTAVITWYGNGLADGSQGPDIALIPGLALEQAEVLRDGAAAQYGSDAIAGVMNFVLRNDRSGGSIEFKSGGHLLGDTSNRVDRGVLPGDGDMYTLSGNIGLPLGETGFLNLTGEYGNALPTDRSVQRDDALALINTQGNTSVRDPAQIWGSPEVSDEIKLWANTGYVFGDQMQFYGHGNYVSKTVEGGFYFRNPNTRSGVFGTSDDDGAFLLVGDLLDAQDGVLDGSAGCPRVAVSGGVVTDQAAWQELLANPNCWTFQKMFPGGFTPQFGANVLDASAVAGLKGAGEKLSWDASAAWGKSNMDFYMYNTVNSSLGPDQPCATDQQLSPHVPDQPCTPYFHPGIYDQQETNLNVDLSYAANERVNFAGGAEFRNERFEIVPGDRASWTEGPLAAQGFTPGSNGFTGFGPLTEGVWNRNNFAVYSDLEIREPEGAWTFGVAGRFENFSDFGSTINGKVAARVSLSEAFALRMSASTGFRAPTPGQSNAFNISTIYDPVIMDLTNNGTIPSTSDLAMEYGGEPLTPETSVNLALGGVVESGNLSMSFDAYQIRMSDRLTFTQDFSLSPPEIDRLLAEGIIRPGGVLARFRFFINDFSTKSEGIDWVAAYRAVGGDGSATTFSTAWNLNRTVVTDHNPQTLSAGRIRILEEGLPNFRGNISVNHDFAGGTRVLARISHWGGYYDGEQPYYEGSSANTIDYPSRNLIDLEAARTFADNWTLTVGAQNVLNTFPQEYPGAAAGVGNTYGQFTPFGFNGGFYYTRLNYSW
ncbi:MAG: TonB-dependent receptor [Gemmatimonadota bacterium]|nr:TonB-dependent receptor [Gemmatimonadota bacterium]MDE2865837.1 TonB-dependent receptor [Gemmatimonadota bacterium]